MPRAIQLIRASALSDVAQYAYAATAPNDARLLFLAGACPLNEDGTTAAAGDYAGQAARCIENMTQALAAADATICDVISTRVLVASSQRDDLVTVWEVVREAFGDHDVRDETEPIEQFVRLDVVGSGCRIARARIAATAAC